MNDCFSTYEKKEVPYERFRALVRPKELYSYGDNLVGETYVYAHCYTGNPEDPDYNPNAKDWIEVRLNCPALNRQYPSWEIAEVEERHKCRIFCIGFIKPAAIGRLMREYKLDVMHENRFFSPAEEALLFSESRERSMALEEEFLRFLMEGYIWPGLYGSYRMARAIMNHEGDLSFSAYVFDDNASFMKIRKEWTFDVFRRRFKPSHGEFIRISDILLGVRLASSFRRRSGFTRFLGFGFPSDKVPFQDTHIRRDSGLVVLGLVLFEHQSTSNMD